MTQPIEIPDATREPQAYVEALLATLGDQDPLDVYGRTPDVVGARCRSLDDQRLQAMAIPREWSAAQIIGHLADVDIVYGFRLRLVLTEDQPTYPGYNEKAWSELARPQPSTLLATFTLLRKTNVALMESLGPEEWAKTGVHGEQGHENNYRMLEKLAGHDLAHINQLDRTLAALSPAARTGGRSS